MLFDGQGRRRGVLDGLVSADGGRHVCFGIVVCMRRVNERGRLVFFGFFLEPVLLERGQGITEQGINRALLGKAVFPKLDEVESSQGSRAVSFN